MPKRRASSGSSKSPLSSMKKARRDESTGIRTQTQPVTSRQATLKDDERLSIEEYLQQTAPVKAAPSKWEQYLRVRDRLDPGEAMFEPDPQEFTIFRPWSPVPSDEDSTIYDPDADEFDAPMISHLDNDDPSVEHVFNAASAQRLQKRVMRMRRSPTPPRGWVPKPNTARKSRAAGQDLILPLPRRLTRRAQQQRHCEIDARGQARLVPDF